MSLQEARSKLLFPPTTQYLSIFSHEIFYPASASHFCGKYFFSFNTELLREFFNLHCTVSSVIVFVSMCSFIYCTLPTQQAVSSARCFCRKKSPALLPAHPMSPYNLFLHSVTDSSSKLFAIWNIASTVFLPTRPVYVPLPHHMFVH